MKNVLRRAIELLNLLSDNENLTTENIKDSISDYRDLNQQAFRRSFERDKNLLRSFGYLIQYENDKWSYDKGYSLSGYSIYESIIKSDKISSEKLINRAIYLTKGRLLYPPYVAKRLLYPQSTSFAISANKTGRAARRIEVKFGNPLSIVWRSTSNPIVYIYT